MPDEKARELIHGYYACISYIDAQIGKITGCIGESGQKENTLIVLWGDHGWHLGDHGLWNKHTNFEHATHVPLLIIDHSHKARQIEAPVEFLSVYPTLCDLAGLSVPAGFGWRKFVQDNKRRKKCRNHSTLCCQSIPESR